MTELYQVIKDAKNADDKRIAFKVGQVLEIADPERAKIGVDKGILEPLSIIKLETKVKETEKEEEDKKPKRKTRSKKQD